MRTIGVFGDKYDSFAIWSRFNSDCATLHQTVVPVRITTLQIVGLLHSSHAHSQLLTGHLRQTKHNHITSYFHPETSTLYLKKRIHNIFSCNLSRHCLIFIIFGTNINKGLDNQDSVFSHRTEIVTLHKLAKQKNTKIASFHSSVVSYFTILQPVAAWFL